MTLGDIQNEPRDGADSGAPLESPAPFAPGVTLEPPAAFAPDATLETPVTFAPIAESTAPASKRPKHVFVATVAVCFLLAMLVSFISCDQESGANSGSSAAQPASSTSAAASGASDASASTSAAAASASAQPANQETSEFDSATEDYGPFGGAPYEEGAVLVTLPDGASVHDALAKIQSLVGLGGVSLAEEGSDFAILALPDGLSVEDAVARIGRSGAVATAQPNYTYEIAETVDPAAALAQDRLARTLANPVVDLAAQASLVAAQSDQLTAQADANANEPNTNDPYVADGDMWGLESIRAFEAWNTQKTNGAVTVAVIDEGFDITHEDLKSNIVSPFWAIAAPSSSTKVSGRERHGTFVAGIVAAQANNKKGVAGVSYNAKVMPIKVSEVDGSMDTSSLLRAYDHIIDYAKKNPSANLRVVNMSLGALRTSPVEPDEALNLRIEKAFDAGIVTVAAACNSGTYTVNGSSQYYNAPFYAYPCDFDKVVGVISLRQYTPSGKTGDTSDVQRMSSSNYNKGIQRAKNIAAPGEEIYSTYPDPLYNASQEGTSMASPHVAGVLALMFAADPGLTAGEAISKLYSTATDIRYSDDGESAGVGWDIYTGYGEVNAAGAVASAPYLKGEMAIDVGGTTKLTVSQAATSGSWKWSTSNSSIARVSTDGTVTGLAAGQVDVYATDGERTAHQAIAVSEPTITGAESIALEAASASYSVVSQIGGSWTWASSNTSVATISSAGKLTAKKAGTTTISATSKSNPSIKASLRVTIVPTSISGTTITASTRVAYAGGAQAEPTIVVKYGTAKLKEGTDYIVTYAGGKSLGRARATIEGIGNYEGSRSFTYKVVRAPISNAAITGLKSKTYTGRALVQKLKLKLGSVKLVEGVDYTLAYSNNVKAGTATVVVEGMGGFNGSKTLTFKIKKAANPLKVTAITKTAKAKALKKKARVVARPLKVSKARGTVTYKKVSGSAKLKVNSKTGKVTVRKGTKKGTYKLKIRVTAKGTANYKKATKTVATKIRVR